MKRHPSVRLEHVVEYGEPLPPPVSDPRMQAAAGVAANDAGAVERGAGKKALSKMGAGAAFGSDRLGAGFCFMNSPGNDLESIAGQVASGCNIVYFSTGNGSITNFPFVPTIKIVSSTKRYELLSADMDVDAADPSLTEAQRGEALFTRTLAVASGERTKGEAAGHYQLQIWRNWELPSVAPSASSSATLAAPPALAPAAPAAPPPSALAATREATAATPATTVGSLGTWCTAPLGLAPLRASATRPLDRPPRYRGFARDGGSAGSGGGSDGDGDGGGGAGGHGWSMAVVPATERIALILPTSLCSSEVARALAAELQAEQHKQEEAREGHGSAGVREGHGGGVRFVALPHTEGCGVSDERLSASTLLGHLTSPLVSHALLLEHGCEKTHNDYFSARLREAGADPARFGWASLQADGGIRAAKSKVGAWFDERLPSRGVSLAGRLVEADTLRLGMGLMVAGGEDCLAGESEAGDDADAAPLADGCQPGVPAPVALCLANLANLVGRHGLLVMPEGCPLLRMPTFLEAALAESPRATLSYAGHVTKLGRGPENGGGGGGGGGGRGAAAAAGAAQEATHAHLPPRHRAAR